MNVTLGNQHPGWITSRGPTSGVSTIVEAFRRYVRQTPPAQALSVARAVHGQAAALTYAELDVCGQALARLLVARGVKRGDRVGLATQRGFDVAVGILAGVEEPPVSGEASVAHLRKPSTGLRANLANLYGPARATAPRQKQR